MKHFIATSMRTKTVYGHKVTMEVYQIKMGRPVFIGSCIFDTVCKSGEEAEAFEVINNNCQGFKKLFRHLEGYYRPNNLLTIDVL